MTKRRKYVRQSDTAAEIKAAVLSVLPQLRGRMTAQQVAEHANIAGDKTTATAIGIVLDDAGVRRYRTKSARYFVFAAGD
ncbi:hypothetical protein RSW49_22630 [Escherichia coli]|nr:hypothetical protein [Escherichia coli]